MIIRRIEIFCDSCPDAAFIRVWNTQEQKSVWDFACIYEAH